jgi:phosphoribosylaminoimidazole-succinocarboxamide synthase
MSRGKVRDTYDLGDKLLMVTTDRLSAFDVMLPNSIPYKGFVLNGLSTFWFDKTRNIIANHVISSDFKQFPKEVLVSRELDGRSMLVKKAMPLKVECVVRGYLAGSGWESYKKGEDICGVRLPPGLKESDKLPESIFTPTTKAEVGHDMPITMNDVREMVGKDIAQQMVESSIKIYENATKLSEKKGLILADTKLEFGIVDDELILIDELLTPDSSRFWPLREYMPGRKQRSLDRQYLKDYLDGVGWNKQSPAPALPEEVINATTRNYVEVYESIIGKMYGGTL